MKKLLIFLGIVAMLALPIKLVLNYTEGATIRTTLVSRTGTTLIAKNASGFPGTGWMPNTGTIGVAAGTTRLTKAACDAQGTANWAWFADMNNDGDTSDGEDGACVQTKATQSALPNASWNGAVLFGTTLASTTANGGSGTTITTATTLTANIYASSTVRFSSATNACWGIVRSNTASTITVYGQWLDASYNTCTVAPGNGDTFRVYKDGQYDNSFIGDYTCTGNFPSGTVVAGTNPATTDTGALAVTDCLDGKRDLLSNETDRAIISGTITAIVQNGDNSTSTVTNGNLTGSFDDNVYIGQKLLITSGTGVGSWGIIESNTSISSSTNVIWNGTPTLPTVGSGYKIIYIIPRGYKNGIDDIKQNNGPLTPDILKTWKGTRLPTNMDWFDYCGKTSATGPAVNGNGAYATNSTDPYSASKTFGNYGGQIGRTNQILNLANSGSFEWLSEQAVNNFVQVGGNNACSYITYGFVLSSIRIRAIFRP